MAPTIKVIDISHHQPDPDFAKVKASGVLAVILKATEGTSYVDPTWRSRRDKAVAAGLKFSTYHFFKGGNVTKQMDFYLKEINPANGERICIDHETDATLAELEQAVTYIKSKRPDLQITVYSGHTLKDQLGGKRSAVLTVNTSLWLAQYTTGTPSWPKETWPYWSLWQFTDKGSVPGISGNVDGNAWNGNDEALAAWFGPADNSIPDPQPTPDPTPEPADEVVEINMNLASGTKFALSINNKKVAEGTA